MEDPKLAAEEARRQAQHDFIKTRAESDVNAEIAARIDGAKDAEAQKMDSVAGELRGKAINEVVETEHEVGRARGMARAGQVVDYLFYVIYSLLALRLLLAMMAARSGAGFTRLINGVTDPFYVPFKGIVASPSMDGGYTLVVPLIVAILVYALAHAGIKGLLRLVVYRKTEI